MIRHIVVLTVVVRICIFLTPVHAELILHYSFDEAPAGAVDAVDSGATPAANGVFQEAASRTSQTPGQGSLGALDLTADGVDYVTTSDDADKLDVLQKMTVSFWLNYRGRALNSDILLSNDSIVGDTTRPKGWDISVTNNRAPTDPPPPNDSLLLQFTMRQYSESGGSGGTGKIAGFSGEFDADEKWLFVAVTYDGDDRGATNFFFGNESETVEQIGQPGFLDRTNGQNMGGFTVGFGSVAKAALKSPDAWIDDVRVYDELLTLDAIEAVRLKGIGVPEPSGGYLLVLVLALLAIQRDCHRLLWCGLT